MHRLVEHIRGNVISYLALFCALSGTGYAAITIPRSSVGTRQLRNGAVTPGKLNAGLTGGYVRAWAGIGAGGRVEVSGGIVHTGQDGPGAWVIFWPGQDGRCRVIGSIDAHGQAPEAPGFVLSGAPSRGRTVVQIYNAQGQPADLPFDVELLCPTPS
jgi:hypothetical protein